MKAVVYGEYGDPQQVLDARQVEVPAIGSDEVLVEAKAASVNALDWHMITGKPYIARPSMGWRKPERSVPGNDVAGVVIKVGDHVSEFRPGDEVFGESPSGGGFAEYIAVEEEGLVAKPDKVTFEEAAAVPVAAFTALQGLRDWGGMRSGDDVLIVGASGGVGTYAVQIAKALGATHVTAVCSSRNVEQAWSIGADSVVDYQKGDFAEEDRRYDVIFDGPGNRPLSIYRRLLKPGGRYLQIGGAKGDWLGPIPRLVRMYVVQLFGYMKVGMGVAARSKKDLETLRDWLEADVVNPVIDRNYKFDEAVEALEYQGTFHARGKIVVTI